MASGSRNSLQLNMLHGIVFEKSVKKGSFIRIIDNSRVIYSFNPEMDFAEKVARKKL